MQSNFCVKKSKEFIEKVFDDSLLPSLIEFIKIDNLSRGYDEHWATNGKLEKAANHIKDWV
jgi:hypothetical protein